MHQRVVHAMTTYVAVLMLIVTFKPTFFCHPDGSLKPFGIGEEETLFAAPAVALALAMIVYFVGLFFK